MNRRIKTLLVLPLVATLVSLGVVGVSGASSGDTVAVVGYSTVSTAYTALETAFQSTPAGQGVTFTNSFGASGTQAQDVAAGLPADVLNLSLIPDMNIDVTSGVVPRNWQKDPISKAEDGFVGRLDGRHRGASRQPPQHHRMGQSDATGCADRHTGSHQFR